jgi:pimeloyl-ACP methyl ester carboxylesterase
MRHEEILELPDGVKLQAYIYDSDITPQIAPSILFLHGLGGFAQDFNFEPMLSGLALAGYRVFAYDFRASGRSRKTTDPTIFRSLIPDFIHLIYEDPKYALDWMLNHEGVDSQ